MAKCFVVNKSDSNVELLIPAPYGSGRSSACFVLEKSQAIDILPWAGSMELCRRIGQLTDLSIRGVIEVVEEE